MTRDVGTHTQLLVRCADARCNHPQGWHRRGVGSCLECGCVEFETGTIKVLRDSTGLTHFLHDDGHPWCRTDSDAELVDHPKDHAAMWCSVCMSAIREACRDET